MSTYNNILSLIGKTPLVKINNLVQNINLYAKVEFFNPSGSIKDRTAYYLINDAINNGLIDKNTTIIEPTSGNTGIGLAMICAVLGMKLILTMPENMSIERIKLLESYGATIHLTPKEKGMQGSIDKAIELNNKIENSYIPQQFKNSSNLKAHYETTALEIWDDLDGKIDCVVAGIGTGGTITGIAKKLKELKPNIKIIGFEPDSSPLITKGETGIHKIQGIGANFIPEILDLSLIDEIYTIKDEDAIECMKQLTLKEGIFAGISSGAAIKTTMALSMNENFKDKTIVAILPDSGNRYLCT